MTDLMEALRHSVEDTRHHSVEDTRKRSRKADSGPDLADLTKADLGKRAKEPGIAGRSKMKRAELAKVVKKAS